MSSDAPSAESSGDYNDDTGGWSTPDNAAMQDKSAQGEISRLWNEIREQRLAAGLSAEPLVSESTQVESLSVNEIQGDADHPEPKSQVCIDTCKIEASICKNAWSICRLANTISDNQWAAEKCNSGKASCKEAKQKCTNCVVSESATLPE